MYPLLYDNFGSKQYGFKSNSSTTCALVHLHDSVTKALDNPLTDKVAILAFDLSKAFDTVPHKNLITSLSQTNLPKGFIKLIYSYLSQRYQIVKTQGHESRPSKVTSGVPALYCIYTRDLKLQRPDEITIKYADDSTGIIISYKQDNDIRVKIDSATDNFGRQCIKLGLSLNRSKTQSIVIGRKYSNQAVKQIKLLCVIFNDKLP